MPTIQPAELWRESGRYDDYGKEMLRISDRHDREMLYGPTNEEQVTAIVRDAIKSYRDLPKNLYHIQWKFRDEVRPRFGVMRGREFLMKDALQLRSRRRGAKHSYNKMLVAYLRTFARMGLKAIPTRADTGPIGGELSHDSRSSPIPARAKSIATRPGWRPHLAEEVDYARLEPFSSSGRARYAATDEMHDRRNAGAGG